MLDPHVRKGINTSLHIATVARAIIISRTSFTFKEKRRMNQILICISVILAIVKRASFRPVLSFVDAVLAESAHIDHYSTSNWLFFNTFPDRAIR